MQPSSLIFVLVVAIWAVYLLQYWIKRRDHLSTVRSVDRFSAAMRILDDHRMRRESGEPMPRSYAVAPTRASRPEITVKHAEAPQRGHLVEPVVGAPRRIRGLALLTMLVLLPVVALVAVFGPLPWWTAMTWLLGTVAAFGWLRQSVQAERAARGRARAQQRRSQTTARPAAPAAPVHTARPQHTTPVFDVAGSVRASQAAPATQPATEPATEAIAPAAQAPTLEPGTWEPMPVPRPMYTMKAKAERAQPAPLEETAQAQPVPQVIDVEDEELPAIAGWG